MTSRLDGMDLQGQDASVMELLLRRCENPDLMEQISIFAH